MAISIFLDETRRLRTVWRFLLYGAGFVAVQLLVFAIFMAGLLAYVMLVEPAEFPDVPDADVLAEEWTILLLIVAALPTTALVFGLSVVFRRYLDHRSVASMGLVRPGRRPTTSVWGGFLLGLLPIAFVALVAWAGGGFRLAEHSATWLTLLLVPTLILMAFQEEIVFRGYLLQNLLDIRRPWFGVIFTSIVFWLVHALNPHAWASPLIAVNLFGAGVVLALAYLVSGNLWFPTALHLGWNLAQGVLFGLPISGIPVDGFLNLQPVADKPHWLTGGEFGLEASVLVTLMEVVLAAFFLQMLRSRSVEQPVRAC